MNDYSICFDESMYLDSSIKTKNVKGRFSKENYEMNKQFASIKKLKQSIEEGMPLWDVPCMRDNFAEDNNTDGESDTE